MKLGQEKIDDRKVREMRMRRYDARMNKHGHYSYLKKAMEVFQEVVDNRAASPPRGRPADISGSDPAADNLQLATDPDNQVASTANPDADCCEAEARKRDDDASASPSDNLPAVPVLADAERPLPDPRGGGEARESTNEAHGASGRSGNSDSRGGGRSNSSDGQIIAGEAQVVGDEAEGNVVKRRASSAPIQKLRKERTPEQLEAMRARMRYAQAARKKKK